MMKWGISPLEWLTDRRLVYSCHLLRAHSYHESYLQDMSASMLPSRVDPLLQLFLSVVHLFNFVGQYNRYSSQRGWRLLTHCLHFQQRKTSKLVLANRRNYKFSDTWLVCVCLSTRTIISPQSYCVNSFCCINVPNSSVYWKIDKLYV